MSRMEPDRIDDKGPWKLPDHRELEGGYPQVPRHPDVLPSDPQSIPLRPSDEIADLKARILKQSRLIDSLFRRIEKMERKK